MPARNKKTANLRDLTDKLENAQEAADTPAAGKREQADLKLLQQEVTAEKLKVQRDAKPVKPPAEGDVDAKLDKALKDSFPGSDPVSFVQAAPINKEDRALSTVPSEAPEEKK